MLITNITLTGYDHRPKSLSGLADHFPLYSLRFDPVCSTDTPIAKRRKDAEKAHAERKNEEHARRNEAMSEW